MNIFEKLGLNSETIKVIKKLGIVDPTEIQRKSIPFIMKKRDVIGESATGSGKTLAFGCGIIENISPQKKVQSLILTPTRELAEQVKKELIKLSKGKHLKTISIYGGVSINPQIHDLQNADIVVATPGRLLDHMQRGTINLSHIKVLVLDEADRMFDMGFIDDVRKIISQCPRKRQTLFFSATISLEIQRFSDEFMHNPIKVSAVNMVDPKKLKQVYYDIQKNMKISLLNYLLKSENSGLVMVFCNTRRNVDFVVKNLKHNKISAIAIHGGFSQNKRTKTMQLFNGAKVGVLVCTDVAARGLHIDNVSHIYNYEIPKDPKDYVHRIGRTARAGENGKVINILCDLDYANFSRILNDYGFDVKRLKKPYLEKVRVVRDDFGGRGQRRSGNRRPWNRQRSGQGRPRQRSSNQRRPRSRSNAESSRRPRRESGQRDNRDSRSNRRPRGRSGSNRHKKRSNSDHRKRNRRR